MSGLKMQGIGYPTTSCSRCTIPTHRRATPSHHLLERDEGQSIHFCRCGWRTATLDFESLNFGMNMIVSISTESSTATYNRTISPEDTDVFKQISILAPYQLDLRSAFV